MEHKPLYQAGFKDINESDLKSVFINPFENSERREYLLTRFGALLDRFKEAGIPSEVWIDGSFSTEKPEPGDIDMIFFVDNKEVNSLPQDKQRILMELNDRNISSIRYNCDVFIIPNQDLNARSYWRGWFGFSRNEEPKGIIRMAI
ncbi:hypothetical protein ES692_17680 [Psychroserpens burtonensis]|uniref:Nucleotidyltransferase domain-containing protein n=1 Tax=Psychroserpens burtonensis TaxID=49278 RepID=A0A5C7B3A3_9FLAO|nr:hypothetical protein [Psychroserpens burtonensis]TXE14904.1 hypothetical protein ES692_17680 [Psychroserpens burtonensis]